jgi:chromosome segregation ATPase
MNNPIERDASLRLENAKNKRTEIEQQRALLQARIDESKRALEALAAADEAAKAEAAQRVARLHELEWAATSAAAEELTTQGTTGAASTTKAASAAQATLQAYRKDRATWLATAQKLVAQRASQRAKLEQQIDVDEATLRQNEQLDIALAEQEAAAHADVGECVYARLVRVLDEQQEVCENIAAALDEQDAERRSLYRDALAELRAWPNQMQRFKASYGAPEKPAEDATLRVFDAWLNLLAVLERDGPFIQPIIEGQSTFAALELTQATIAALCQKPTMGSTVRSGLIDQDRVLLSNQRRGTVAHLRQHHRPSPAASLW